MTHPAFCRLSTSLLGPPQSVGAGVFVQVSAFDIRLRVRLDLFAPVAPVCHDTSRLSAACGSEQADGFEGSGVDAAGVDELLGLLHLSSPLQEETESATPTAIAIAPYRAIRVLPGRSGQRVGRMKEELSQGLLDECG